MQMACSTAMQTNSSTPLPAYDLSSSSKEEKFAKLQEPELRPTQNTAPFFANEDKDEFKSQGFKCKENQVVRLETQYGHVPKGSIGIVLYYLSSETFGSGMCQVMLYDAWERYDTPSASETVYEGHLEMCRKTPSWVSFDIDKNGFPTDRVERGIGKKIVGEITRFFKDLGTPTT